MQSHSDILRQIPKVDLILSLLPETFFEQLDDSIIKEAIAQILDQLRYDIINDHVKEVVVNEVILDIIETLNAMTTHSLKKVINASGIVLHTNLGRAVISEQTLVHLCDTMSGYTTLEYDVFEGRRGSRYEHVEALLCRHTGAEAAIVVNNNAAAVLLVLNTFAREKEVILSRGEMVEIGGSFRIPEVMKMSGCQLIEIGTTNKTHLRDYTSAITEKTGLLLKVHTSNYKVVGFTHSVSREEIHQLSLQHSIPFYEDLGSGSFVKIKHLEEEPTVSECISSGVDIVSFSGDKLLGGNQSGIIVGKKKYIDQLKKNQMLRALRIDKLSLVVLEDLLISYLNTENAIEINPTLNMLSLTQDEIFEKVTKFVKVAQNVLQDLEIRYVIEPIQSQIGGGALPTSELPSYGLFISGNFNPNQIQAKLRLNPVPIVCKIESDALVFDFRTIFEKDYDTLAKGLISSFRSI
ncbi:MAG: L-seryl-tRNA(Sec) selenium transferase [Clostridiales bacterium 38-18]|nr:MAG: L-seryl-tRNA(Sec) selenium transferase [Clostridiales bacterium 38-18]